MAASTKMLVRNIGGVALILVALALLAGPAMTLVQVLQSHASGLGPRAVNGVSYLVTAGAFCLLAGLYVLTGGKKKKV